MNSFPVLWRFSSGKNGEIYALQEKGAKNISIQRLWKRQPFIQTKNFQFFRRFIEETIVHQFNQPTEFDGFPPYLFKTEAGVGRTAIWSFPNNEEFKTPLRIYCLLWDDQTLIYLGGFREQESEELLEERHPAEYRRWQHVISAIQDGLETKDFFKLDNRAGFFEAPNSDDPAEYVILEKYNA